MNTFFAMSTLILSGGQVVLGLAAVGAAIYLGIFAAKVYLGQQSDKIKNQSIASSSLVRKYEEVDVYQHARNIKLAGFAAAVAMILIAFAWTQFTGEVVLAEFVAEPDAIEVDVPPTVHERPKLPPALPPPPPKSTTEIEITEVPEPVEPDPEPTVEVSPTPSTYTGPTDPNAIELPPIVAATEEQPEEPEEIDEIILIPDQMPRFPGCEDQTGDNRAKKACADLKLLQFIHQNIKYPAAAREMGIEGMVVVSFVVGKDGKVTDVNILREPGGGCGKEAVRIVKMMNRMPEYWTPGKQRGRPVKVRYNLPVRFRLHN